MGHQLLRDNGGGDHGPRPDNDPSPTPGLDEAAAVAGGPGGGGGRAGGTAAGGGATAGDPFPGDGEWGQNTDDINLGI